MSPSMLPAEITQLRNDLGGNTLLAVVSGSRNRHDAERWTSGELIPTESQLMQLAVSREIFDQVTEKDGADMARRLFWGKNTIVPRPQTVGGEVIVNYELVTLMMAIRDGYLDEARATANKYLNDEWI